MNWNRSKESLNIKGGDGFPWFQPFALELLDKVLGVFEVVWGLAYQGFDDVGSSLATPYVMDPLLETMGLRGCLLCGFGEAIELGWTALVG